MRTLDYTSSIIRSAAILTNSYVAGTVLENVHGLNQIVLLASFTKGNLTTLELKFEFSTDNTTWYQETFQAVSGATATETLGEHQTSATGNLRILVPIKDRYVRVSAKGTGDVTNSSLLLTVISGTV